MASVGLLIMSSSLLLSRALGVQLLSVQTGSMQPLLAPHDLVVVAKVYPADLQVGELISYHSLKDSSMIITHRVVAIDLTKNLITTKGDALGTVDPPFGTQQIVGQVRYHARKLGVVADNLHKPIGLILCIYMPAFMIIGAELVRLRRHYSGYHYALYS